MRAGRMAFSAALLTTSLPLSSIRRATGLRVTTACLNEGVSSKAGRRLGTRQQQVWRGRMCGLSVDVAAPAGCPSGVLLLL